MGTFTLLGVLIAAIAWPSRLISHLAQLHGHSKLNSHLLGPISTAAGFASSVQPNPRNERNRRA